jgi:hypothetical protein
MEIESYDSSSAAVANHMAFQFLNINAQPAF